MFDCYHVALPMDKYYYRNMLPETAPESPSLGVEDREAYASLLGKLLFIGCGTRPDISSALSIMG